MAMTRTPYCLRCCRVLEECACGPRKPDLTGTSVPKTPGALGPSTSLQDRYLIGPLLGKGGFGITYLAANPFTSRTVAVKEYFPQMYARRLPDGRVAPVAGEEDAFTAGLEAFVGEARHLARLENVGPGVVTVYDGFKANGTAYMVMAYIEGPTLLGVVEGRGGALDEQTSVRYIHSVLDGISRIHSRGIFHRDIKPENVIVARDDDLPRLIDFGAAKRADGIARAQIQVWTPGYSPPEQELGEEDNGVASDIHAIGATFYYMVTGMQPPTTEERLAHGMSRLEVPPGRISETTASAIARATEHSPEERFRSAGEFATALGSLLPSMPHTGELASSSYPRPPKHGMTWNPLLVCEVGEYRGISIPLSSSTFRIGRGLDNDLVITQSVSVSRQHLELRFDLVSQYVLATDRSSRCGTHLLRGGQAYPLLPEQEVALTEGDALMVGSRDLVFRIFNGPRSLWQG